MRKVEEQQQPRIPYSELDPNIVKLVRVLNSYPGVTTRGSCGGHEEAISSGSWAAGTWYVTFELPRNRLGWYILEFLAWAINNDAARKFDSWENLVLVPKSPPPFVNQPGEMLHFALESYGGQNPDDLADFLKTVRTFCVDQAWLDAQDEE